jgi:hypothetical protein
MLRYTSLLMFFSMFISPFAYSGGDVPSSFKDYINVQVHEYDIHGQQMRVVGEIYYSPKLNIYKIDSKETRKYGIPDEFETYKLELNGISYVFAANSGASEDYGFIVGVLNSEKYIEIGEVGGSRIFVSHKGRLYSDFNGNNYFDLRQKYLLTPDDLAEVKQPILYINMACKTTSLATLKSTPEQNGGVVAVIPKEQDVTVIGTNYSSINGHENTHEVLIATPFGLTGWVSTELGWDRRPGKPIDCVKYVGD